MSLVVWLPLNGNLNNQGIGEATVTNDGATVDNNGKIGKCYSFNNTRIQIQSNALKSMFQSPSSVFSFATWVYLNSDETDRVIIFGNWNNSPFVNWELSAGHYQVLAAGLTNSYPSKTSGTMIAQNVWTHLAVTYDGENVRFYVNGDLKDTQACVTNISTPMTSNTFWIGSDSRSDATRLKGKMNDFRVYDHVLSPKEVKEISKGLMVHYTLSNPGGQNLVANSAPLDLTGWALYGGADWSLSLVDCSISPFGKAVRSTYTGSGGVQGGIHHQPYDYTALTNGAIYTVSAWIRTSKACDVSFYNEYMATRGETVISTEWKKYKWTSALDTSRSCHSNIFYVRAADVTTNMWIEVFGLKLEKSDHATLWCPHTSDAAYSRMGYNDATEYDVSGFKNNALKKGTLSWDPNTPKYTGSLSFNGATSNWIQIPQATYRNIIGSTEAVTASIWAKHAAWITPSHYEQMFSCQEGGGFIITMYTNNYFVFQVGTGASSNTYKNLNSSKTIANYGFAANSWHMFTLTYDGLVLKGYIDGVLDNSLTCYSTKTPIFYQVNSTLNIGAEASTNETIDTGYMFTGNLSDFRWYATALSPDDILELYNSAGSISNNGTLLTNEVTE